MACCLPGCSKDDPVDPGNETTTLPATRDELMDAFQLAYSEMDSTAYALLLHEDFRFGFFEDSYYGGFDDAWNRDEELAGAGYMFGGGAGDDLLNHSFAGLSYIDCNLTPVSAWADAPLDDPLLPGISRALYQASVYLTDTNKATRFSIDAEQYFYSTETDNGWQLLGHLERQMIRKSIYDLYWNELKWFFRPSSSDPWPDTPDMLMSNFEHAYGEMDIIAYDELLHDEFKFIFIANEDIWHRSHEAKSAGNMFAGHAGQNADGSYVQGVQSIDMISFIRQTPWTAVPGTDPDFPDSERALYQIRIVFYLIGDYYTKTVASDQIFFVKSRDVELPDSTAHARYFLVGQRDIECCGKANEDLSWGAVKDLYSDYLD